MYLGFLNGPWNEITLSIELLASRSKTTTWHYRDYQASFKVIKILSN